jgi:hypothetical protein
MWLALLKLLGVDIFPQLIAAYNKRADTLVANNQTTANVAIKMVEADSELQKTKSSYLAGKNWVTQTMILLLGMPVALHWAAICADSTFKFGWGIPAIPGAYGAAEIEIIKSFFITGVAALAVTQIAGIIKR